MRILIFNWKDPRHPATGGAEVFVHSVARQWVEWGHQVTVACSMSAGLPREEVLDGVTIIRRGGRFGVYRAARKLYRTEMRGQFDIVVDSVNTRPFHATRFVDDAPVVGLIYQVCREIWWKEFPLPIAAVGRFILEKRWLHEYRNHPVITISESSRLSLAEYGLDNLNVVRIGTYIPPIPPVDKEPNPTLLFVGRLATNKRPDQAIEAYRLVRQQLPAARLWIVGTGPLEDELKRSAPPGTQFFGRVTDDRKFELMARAHLLIATSRREGWGLVVTEAAGAGTPSVCYDVAGFRDSVALAGGALSNESPAALAEQVIRMLGRPASEYTPRTPASWSDTASDCLEILEAALDGARAEPSPVLS